jgi:hypothetical protein
MAMLGAAEYSGTMAGTLRGICPLLLYPRSILQEALSRDPGLYAELFAALESLDTEKITGGGRVYGGGLYKMEPKELANLPSGFIAERLALGRGPAALRQRHLFETLEESEHLPA